VTHLSAAPFSGFPPHQKNDLHRRKRKSVQRWRISRIRGSKNEVVGVVTAPDREAVIQEAI
jgi:hypothetical protein